MDDQEPDDAQPIDRLVAGLPHGRASPPSFLSLFDSPADSRAVPVHVLQVGPPGFTAFAFLNLGDAAVGAFPASDILGGAEAGRVFLYVSVWFSFMLYVGLVPQDCLLCRGARANDLSSRLRRACAFGSSSRP